MSIFNWVLVCQNDAINEKAKILSETLMNTFNIFIPSKTSRFDYRKPAWMDKRIISYLKKRLLRNTTLNPRSR